MPPTEPRAIPGTAVALCGLHTPRLSMHDSDSGRWPVVSIDTYGDHRIPFYGDGPANHDGAVDQLLHWVTALAALACDPDITRHASTPALRRAAAILTATTQALRAAAAFADEAA